MDSFHTEGGLRVPAVTAQQMREVDRVAVEEIGPNLHQMMENAGRSLAAACMTMLESDGQVVPLPWSPEQEATGAAASALPGIWPTMGLTSRSWSRTVGA